MSGQEVADGERVFRVFECQPDEMRALRNLLYRVETPAGARTTKIDGPAQLQQILVDDFRVLVTELEADRLYEDLLA